MGDRTLYVYQNPTIADREWCVISEHPVFGEHQGTLNETGEPLEAVAVPFVEIPALIQDLRLAYNQHYGHPDPANFNQPPDPAAEADAIRVFGGGGD